MRRYVLTIIVATVLFGAVLEVNAQVRWADKSNTQELVSGGREYFNQPANAPLSLFVCRGYYTRGNNKGLFVGKTWTGYNKCNIAAFGEEIPIDNYEVLAGSKYKWIESHDTGYPANAVIGGQAGDGRRFLVCIAPFPGPMLTGGSLGAHPGYIADSNCLFGWGGKGQLSKNYLVLVTDDLSVPHEARGQAPHEDSGLLTTILGIAAVGAFCALTGGTCIATLPIP